MKICIYGAGAIGGYLGVQLARAGVDVSLVARGAHLAAMKANGLKLLIGNEERVVHPRCTDNPAELGAQDFVIICLKAHSITGVLEQMQPLLGPHTRVVTAVNGIPYWYFYKHGGAYQNATLETIDPGGRQWRELGAQRAIGSEGRVPFGLVHEVVELDEIDVVRAKSLERATDLIASLRVRALARLRRDEEPIASRTLEPRRDAQLRIAVAGRGIDVIHTLAQQEIENSVRHLLCHT